MIELLFDSRCSEEQGINDHENHLSEKGSRVWGVSPVMKVKLHAQDIIALLRSRLQARGGAGNVPRP